MQRALGALHACTDGTLVVGTGFALRGVAAIGHLLLRGGELLAAGRRIRRGAAGRAIHAIANGGLVVSTRLARVRMAALSQLGGMTRAGRAAALRCGEGGGGGEGQNSAGGEQAKAHGHDASS